MSTSGWPEILFLLRSAGWTLALTAIAFGIGSLVGGVIAIMRLAQNRLLRSIAATYILVIQSIPVLMILFMSCYGLTLMGLDIPPLLAASASLAMTRVQQYRHIILPQALWISLPPTVGFLVQLVKNTSIVSVDPWSHRCKPTDPSS